MPSAGNAAAIDAPDAAAISRQDELDLVVRLHHEVVDTPAPRRSLSPAQALHLASQGPTPERELAIAEDGTIVLPDTRTEPAS